jgi:hypothetical protein
MQQSGTFNHHYISWTATCLIPSSQQLNKAPGYLFWTENSSDNPSYRHTNNSGATTTLHCHAEPTKKTLRLVIEMHLRDVAINLGKTRYTPHVTPELAKNLTQLQLAHHDIVDLLPGIQPFCTTCRTNREMAEIQKIINIYDDMPQGTGEKLTETIALKQVDNVETPPYIVRWSGIHIYNWFNVQVHVMHTFSPPNFHELLDKIQNQ